MLPQAAHARRAPYAYADMPQTHEPQTHDNMVLHLDIGCSVAPVTACVALLTFY